MEFFLVFGLNNGFEIDGCFMFGSLFFLQSFWLVSVDLSKVCVMSWQTLRKLSYAMDSKNLSSANEKRYVRID